MSRMTPVASRKRKLEEAMRGKTSKPRKRVRKQKEYHSSSEDEADDAAFTPVNLGDSDEEVVEPASGKNQKGSKPKSSEAPKPIPKRSKQPLQEEDDTSSSDEAEESDGEGKPSSSKNRRRSGAAAEEDERDSEAASRESDAESDTDASSDSGSDSDSDSDLDGQSTTKRSQKKSKRNDPEAFSMSMSKILGTKLSSNQRSDPVLSRSASVAASRTAQAEAKLEAKARARLRAKSSAALQKGRTTDVLGIERGIAGEVAEKEKQLRKIATRGVIQLFNAFRGAHERAEEARREERKKGTIGIGEREKRVGEIGKEEFLERIGGTKKAEKAEAGFL